MQTSQLPVGNKAFNFKVTCVLLDAANETGTLKPYCIEMLMTWQTSLKTFIKLQVASQLNVFTAARLKQMMLESKGS